MRALVSVTCKSGYVQHWQGGCRACALVTLVLVVAAANAAAFPFPGAGGGTLKPSFGVNNVYGM